MKSSKRNVKNGQIEKLKTLPLRDMMMYIGKALSGWIKMDDHFPDIGNMI